MRSHMRDSGPFRSCGRPDSRVRRTESDSASASSMALKRSPRARVSLGPDGCTRCGCPAASRSARSEEHTSELQSLMRISYAVFCLKKKKNRDKNNTKEQTPPTYDACTNT